MKLALIAPRDLLEWQTTGYQLMLPHIWQSDINYQEQYRQFKLAGDFIILDNGAAEGVAISDKELLYIATQTVVDEIAIPDILGDSQGTYERLCNFFRHNEARLVAMMASLTGGPKLGFVAQGETASEAMDCVDKIMGSAWAPYLDTVYLPRLLLQKSGELFERIKLSQMLHNVYRDRLAQHFFGSSPLWTREVLAATAECPWVRGIDTSLPFNMTFAGASLIQSPSIWDQQLPKHKIEAPKRPEGYFDLSEDQFDKDILEFNCRVYTAWAVKSGITKAPFSEV